MTPEYRDELKLRIIKHCVVLDTGCWEWIGGLSDSGYGRIWVLRRLEQAHRASFLAFNGDISDGRFVCHSCDNKRCVNPSHLFLGTHLENMADMVSKGRRSIISGARNGRTKLTDDQVASIRADTRKYRHIAREFGVSISHIEKISAGVSRKVAAAKEVK